jgi:hypothetical protein
MNKPVEQDQIGTVVLPTTNDNLIATSVPLIYKRIVKVYLGETHHSSITVYTDQQMQDTVKYYLDRGYTTEVVEE